MSSDEVGPVSAETPGRRARLVAEWRVASEREAGWRVPTPSEWAAMVAAGEALAAALGEAGTPPRAPDAPCATCGHPRSQHLTVMNVVGHCGAMIVGHTSAGTCPCAEFASRPEVVTPDAPQAQPYSADVGGGTTVHVIPDHLVKVPQPVTPDATEAAALATWDEVRNRVTGSGGLIPTPSDWTALKIAGDALRAVLLRAPRPVSPTKEQIEAMDAAFADLPLTTAHQPCAEHFVRLSRAWSAIVAHLATHLATEST